MWSELVGASFPSTAEGINCNKYLLQTGLLWYGSLAPCCCTCYSRSFHGLAHAPRTGPLAVS